MVYWAMKNPTCRANKNDEIREKIFLIFETLLFDIICKHTRHRLTGDKNRFVAKYFAHKSIPTLHVHVACILASRFVESTYNALLWSKFLESGTTSFFSTAFCRRRSLFCVFKIWNCNLQSCQPPKDLFFLPPPHQTSPSMTPCTTSKELQLVVSVVPSHTVLLPPLML